MDSKSTPLGAGAPEHRRVEAGTHVYEDDAQRGGGKRGRGHGRVTEVKYKAERGLVAYVRFDRRPRDVYRMTARRAGDLKVTHDRESECG